MFVKNCLFALTLLFAGAANATPNLLVNGDFSSMNFDGWTTYTTSNGVLHESVLVAQLNGPSSWMAGFKVGDAVFDGTQQGGGIKQSFLSSAGTFSMSTEIGVKGDTINGNLSAGIFKLIIDSIVVDSVSFGQIAPNQSFNAMLSYTGNLGAGMHELSILMTRPHSVGANPVQQYLDNVLVTQLDGAPVPEPGIFSLLGIGLACMAALRGKARGHVGNRAA